MANNPADTPNKVAYNPVLTGDRRCGMDEVNIGLDADARFPILFEVRHSVVRSGSMDILMTLQKA